MQGLLAFILNNRWLCLIIGGALGAVCRYGIVQWVWQPSFPAGTLTVNVVSCLLLGVFLGVLEGRLAAAANPPATVLGMPLDTFVPQLRLLIVTGFLGSLSTFSSIEMEAFLMVKDEGAWLKPVAYLLGSLALGFAALWMSYSWARWCFGEIKWN